MKNRTFKWPMRKRVRRRLTTAIFSVFLSTLVFITVTTGEGNNNGLAKGAMSSTYSHTLRNIPINFKYDSDDYYISGHASTVSVVLSSSNRVNLATELDKSTRNFQIVADLTGTAEGTSKVELSVHNLPAGMTAKIVPNTVTVTIGKRQTKEFDVRANVPEDRLAKGYSLEGTSLSLDRVKVTSNATTISQIDHVEAKLPETIESLTEDYEGKVSLQAVDASGNILPATIEPQTADLSVSISTSTKKVPVKVAMEGTTNPAISSIEYSLDKSSVTLRGKKENLDKISEVSVTVDVSDIIEDKTQTVTLSAGDGVFVEPETIDIKWHVKHK